MRTIAELTINDAVEPADQGPYAELSASLQQELCPEGLMECVCAAQILRNIWRLQCCERRADTPEIDKRRHRATNGLRRATADLRQLQTERHLRTQLESGLTGLASTKELVLVARAAATKPTNGRANEPTEAEIREMEARIDQHLKKSDGGSQQIDPTGAGNIPRNSPCPCKSGQKYKRCCGRTALPNLNVAQKMKSAA
jgi:hypothetical protein